jgi:acetylornithine deacetylase/succinyl-diaminopimelate desuccinylase-like protein
MVRGVSVLVVGILALMMVRDQFAVPAAQSAAAPETAFSAARAIPHIEAVAVAPRPQGSEAAAAARAYISGELRALGLTPEVQTAATLRTTEGTDTVFGATVVNVMARIPGTDSSGAIVLSGHYDSGPNALGAGDCGSCVATLLEVGRALLAGPRLRNDVILLFPDGEETQLFGSRAFMQQHPWAKDVRFALNLESQGTNGPAVFYVSSEHDARVAGEVIASAEPAAWSFLNSIVRKFVVL